MADMEQTKLKPLDGDVEEMKEQIRSHRKKIGIRIVCIVAVILLALVATRLWFEIRTFSDYSVLSTTERSDSAAVNFASFGDYILKYSNDGAVCMDGDDSQIWNQSYEMTNPRVTTSDDYAAIYDRGSIDIYLMSKTKTVGQIEVAVPIVSVSVSDQGTLAVLMQDDSSTYVKLFDKTGKELAAGRFYEENGGFPVDLALSYDGKKMAVDMVDISDGNLRTTITFYNFGSVGQNEINNTVGTYTYSDMFIPEIEYVSDDRMIALGDNEIIYFSGAEKPTVSAEIFPEEDPLAICYDDKHVAMIYQGTETEERVIMYDAKGKKVMDVNSDMMYENIYFLENGELCITNDTQCEIYTAHRIRKFKDTFDHKICRILSQESGARYIFVFEDSTQEVRLK